MFSLASPSRSAQPRSLVGVASPRAGNNKSGEIHKSFPDTPDKPGPLALFTSQPCPCDRRRDQGVVGHVEVDEPGAQPLGGLAAALGVAGADVDGVTRGDKLPGRVTRRHSRCDSPRIPGRSRHGPFGK
jgi:hypothetical protein